MHHIKLTAIGQQRQAASLIGGPAISITSVAVGDGGGAAYEPTGAEVAMVNERWRGALAQGQAVAEPPGLIRLETYMPASVGGFTIREIGLFDSDGVLIAIGALDWPKAALTNGSAEDLRIVINLRVSNPESFTLQVDPTVAPVSLAQMQEASSAAKSEAIQAAGQAAAQALSSERQLIDQAISQAVSGALSTCAQNIATAKSEAVQEAGQASAQQVSDLAAQIADQLAAANARTAAVSASYWADVPVTAPSAGASILSLAGGAITPGDMPTFLLGWSDGSIMHGYGRMSFANVGNSQFGDSAVYGIAIGAGLAVAVGANGKIATSPDGSDWTARTSGTTSDINQLAYTHHGFFANASGTLLHSVDGITWSPRAVDGETLHYLAYSDGLLLAATESVNKYSGDGGITWTDLPSMFYGVRLGADAYGKGVLVGVDQYGQLMATADLGETWRSIYTEDTPSVIRFDGEIFVAATVGGQILVSPDGFEWGAAPHSAGVTQPYGLAKTPAGWLVGGAGGKLQRTMRVF